MKEIWKDIPNYKGMYQTSNLGNVRSLKWGKETILKPAVTNSGYKQVILSLQNTKKAFTVHKLVAICFLNHKQCGHQLVVNHKNFIKTDNRVDNLEVVTSRDNLNRKHLKSSSQYTGVSFYSRYNKWTAYIYYNNKQKNLGYFNSELEASNAYQNKLKEIKTI